MTCGSPSLTKITLDNLPFDNAAIRELPVDPELHNHVRIVPNACFSKVAPDPVENPVLVATSRHAFGLLGLGIEEADREDAAEFFSGEGDIWFHENVLSQRLGLLVGSRPEEIRQSVVLQVTAINR